MATPTRTRGQRAGLSTADVLTAAAGIVRDSGHEALSMRSVAARLGVAPNALYSHVDGKDALVDALLDEPLHEIDVPDPDGDPAAEVRRCMLATFDLLVSRAELVPLYLARHGSRGPRAVELGEALEVLLRQSGVPQDQTGVVVRVLVLVTIGIAAQAVHDGPLSGALFRDTLESSVEWIVQGAAG